MLLGVSEKSFYKAGKETDFIMSSILFAEAFIDKKLATLRMPCHFLYSAVSTHEKLAILRVQTTSSSGGSNTKVKSVFVSPIVQKRLLKHAFRKSWTFNE